MTTMDNKEPLTPQAEKLKQLVSDAGGPAAFATKYSKDANNPIDPTYVSQILNGHRGFRDVARRNMAIRAGLSEDFFETTPKARQKTNAPYVVQRQTFTNDPAISEVIQIMEEVGTDARRDILGAARLALTQFRLNQQNSKQLAHLFRHRASLDGDKTNVILLSHWKSNRVKR